MIALVRIALSRPYTFVVLALLLLLIGPLAALRTPTDIFPDIRIPVIGVVWNYTRLPPDQVALSGEGLTEQNLADIGINQLRTPLVTVQGAAIPYPFGGKQRQIQIDLNSTALQARGLSGQDVSNALAAQNLITPVGTQKIGQFEYTIQLNNSPLKMEDLGGLPIKAVNVAMV